MNSAPAWGTVVFQVQILRLVLLPVTVVHPSRVFGLTKSVTITEACQKGFEFATVFDKINAT